jgi:glycosyltransferase involved in cell wall biosynthesis
MSTNEPLVSIVTCTYNRGHLIGETVRSVLQQTWQRFEYIIVDDGSTDNTAEIIESFREPRIKYIRHERTGGHLSRLRNFAHGYCSGDYIAYVDSDDLWEPDKLRTQITGLDSSPSGFSFTDIVIFDTSGVLRASMYPERSGTFSGNVFPQMLDNQLVICHTSLVLKRACLDKTGPMDEEMHSGDHDMVFFLSRYFDAFAVYRPLVRVRKHEGNTTSNAALNLKLLIEHHHTLKKLMDRKLISGKEYEHSLAVTSYSFGRQLLAANDLTSALKYFRKGWRLRPWHLKSAAFTALASAKKILG